MVIDILLLSIAGIALLIGTITDLKTREVPDWLNYSLIFAGIGLRLLYSSMTFEWSYLLEGVVGLGVFFAIGYFMYYAGQWGGGDSKMLMGIGALIGIPLTLNPIPLLLVFLFNSLLVGSIYGTIYSIVLAAREKKKFARHFKEILQSDSMKKLKRGALLSLVILTAILFFVVEGGWILSSLFILFLYLSVYLAAFIKAVEAAAMFKFISPEALTEGDWIAKDVIIRGKRICGPKDLGIEKKQIKKLIALKKQGKLKTVKVKYGMPFVPSFFIAFVLTLFLGAWWIRFF